MTLVNDVLMALNKLAPFDTALPWDNVGLIIGDKSAKVTACVVALDCTVDIVDYAIKVGASLIVTHHPVIFDPLKAILASDIAFLLVRANISVISAHTNLDLAQNGVNKALADRLGLKHQRCFENADMLGVIGELNQPFTPHEFSDFLKSEIHTNSVCYVDCGKEILTVAVVGGAGDDFLLESKIADAYVTGEVRHYCYCEAKNNGIQLFTVGHHYSEVVVIKPLALYLSEMFKEITFNVNEAPPFMT